MTKRNLTVCVWTEHVDFTEDWPCIRYSPSCRDNDTAHYSHSWIHCPFCGKKITEKKA